MQKVIIVDDEQAGRSLIREYLEDYPDLIVMAEVNNGVDAVKEINRFKPDLVFLDIQMPGLTGFEVITRLDELPQIIFSTAYDKYALKAFEVHAVDYLLKPYTKDRFRVAVERLGKSNSQDALAPLTNTLLMESNHYPERVLVSSNKKLITVEVAQIAWIEAYGDYSKLHTPAGSFVSNYGISSLVDKLDPKLFLRVHRSAMVNLTAIKEVAKYGKSYEITVKSGEKVRVSRGYAEAVKNLIV